MSLVNNIFLKNKIVKYFTILPVSTLLGQGINTIVTIYLLKKYYSPYEFGIYSNFIALSILLSVLFSFKLEIILGVIDRRLITQYFNYILKVIFGFFIFIILINFIFFGKNLWVGYSIFSGLVIALQNLVRQFLYTTSKFIFVFIDNIIRPIFQIVLPIFFIKSDFRLDSLLFSFILGSTIGLSIMFIGYFSHLGEIINLESVKFSKFLSDTKSIVFYNLPTQLINIIGVTLMPIYLSFLYDSNVTGQFSFANTLLSIPAALFGSTFSQILFPILNRKNIEDKREIILFVFFVLFTISNLFFIPIIIFGQEIFTFFFNLKWMLSAKFSNFLAFFYFASIISTTLSPLTIIFKKNNIAFYISIIEAFLRIISIYIGYLLGSFFTSIILFSIVNTLIYITYTNWTLGLVGLNYSGIVKKNNLFFIINLCVILMFCLIKVFLPLTSFILILCLFISMLQFVFNVKTMINENFNFAILVQQ